MLALITIGLSRNLFRLHFISLGLAYCLFYSMSYVHPFFSPNLNKVGARLLSSLEAQPPRQPVYLHGYGALQCEMHHIQVQPFMYDEDLIKSLLPLMEKTGGTVVIADAPAIGEKAPLRNFLNKRAVLKRTFSDDGVVLAEIWQLNPK